MNPGRYLILFLCLLACFSGKGQTLSYNILTVESGLPSNSIHTASRDSKGYIWFSTKNGVARWDSKNFEYFTIADGLPNNEVYQSYEDSKKRIWLPTFSRSLCFYFNGKIYNQDNTPFLKKIKIYPASLVVEVNNELYFVSSTLKLSKLSFADSSVTTFNNRPVVTHAYLIKNGHKLWVLEHGHKSGNLISSVDTSFRVPYNITPNTLENDTLSKVNYKDRIYSFQRGFDKAFASYPLSSDDAIFVLYNSGNYIEVYPNRMYFRKTNHTLQTPEAHCQSIIDGIVFTCSEERLIECRQIPILEFSPEMNISNNIHFLLKEGPSIYGINVKNEVVDIKAQKTITQITNNAINTYNLSRSKSNYYLSTSKNIFCFNQQFNNITRLKGIQFDNNFKPNFKYVIPTKRNPNLIYFANGFNGGIFLFNPKTRKNKGLLSDTSLAVYSIFEETHSSRIWFSTLDKVYVSDSFKKDGTLSYHEFILDKKIPLFCSQFVEDSYGNIFFVTNGGIFIYNGKHIYRLNKANLLTDNECNKIIINNARNDFWVATKNGLSQIKYSTQNDKLHFEVVNKFYKTDGLFSNIINDILLDSNKLYIATDKGVNVLDDINYRPKRQTIPVYINLEAINGKPLQKNAQPDVSHLKYNQNNLTVHFSALYFMRRNRLKVKAYLYIDSELISQNEITEDRINYYSLNEGNYKLVLYAFDQDYHYIHGQSAPFAFTIYPPYYKTWWFICSVGLFIIIVSTAILLWSLSRRKARALKQAELNAKLNESTLKSLQSQMNPHFVFNSLNTIQHFITSKKEADALDYLSDFSRLMRNMLEQSVLTLISLENEISFLHQYIQLEKTRFVNSFELTWDVQLSEDDIVDIYIPTMLIQPILENAVKHGISNLIDKKGKIEVSFSLQNENLLLVTIRDNGKTFYHKSKKGNSIALQTIKDRLNIYTKNNNKGEYNLLITEEGATATITIPI